MKKLFIILYTLLVFLLLGACSNANSSGERITEVTFYKIENGNEKLIITDSEAISVMVDAVNGAREEPGIVNMSDPPFKFRLGEETYLLWVDEASGTIMNTEDTHVIYSLSTESAKKVYGLLLE